MKASGDHQAEESDLNGGAVNPADAPNRMKQSMCATTQAWDVFAKDEIMHDCHNADRLMFHMWSLIGGNPNPVGGGDEPRNITAEQARRWIPKDAVYIHRVKDDSLLKLHLSGEF
jgi:hypothetical protein